MSDDKAVVAVERIEKLIYLSRGQKVMLDSDLAEIHGIPTHRLNEQVRRNLSRFPEDFAFQLTRQEFANLISQIAISKRGRAGRRKFAAKRCNSRRLHSLSVGDNCARLGRAFVVGSRRMERGRWENGQWQNPSP
jgi:hypothetical protein